MSRPLFAIALLGLLGACGEDAPETATAPLGGLTFQDGALVLEVVEEPVEGVHARLSPVLYAEGQRWTSSEPCTPSDDDLLACDLPDVGVLRVSLEDESVVTVELEAGRDITVEGLALEGELSLPGANAWLSNGYHSWSQSGALALGPAVEETELKEALETTGDLEVLREGHTHSWWMTWVAGGAHALSAGVTSADVFKSWAQVSEGETKGLRLVSGLAGEQVALKSGDLLRGEHWHLTLSDDLEGALLDYARAVPSRRMGQEEPPPAEAGWNSWYELWDGVDETAVREHAALLTELFAGHSPDGLPLRVVIDDGWQRNWGDWWPNQKFPSGLDGLAADLHADGFEVGVWIAPMLVREDSELASEHPDWLVGDVTYWLFGHGNLKVLDVTHPEAAAHLQAEIARLVSWGYDLLKIDYLFAATLEGTHHEPITGMGHLKLALELIREAAGEDTLLLAVATPHVPALEFVDSWRVGGDIAVSLFDAAWAYLPNQLRSIAARWSLCHVTLCDPDPPILRTLPENEVLFGAWTVATAGGALFLSDDLRPLSEDRRAGAFGDGRETLSVIGFGAIPDDLVPEAPPAKLSSPIDDHAQGFSAHVVPTRWRLQDGRILGMNVTEETVNVDGVGIAPRSARLLEAP